MSDSAIYTSMFYAEAWSNYVFAIDCHWVAINGVVSIVVRAIAVAINIFNLFTLSVSIEKQFSCPVTTTRKTKSSKYRDGFIWFLQKDVVI